MKEQLHKMYGLRVVVIVVEVMRSQNTTYLEAASFRKSVKEDSHRIKENGHIVREWKYQHSDHWQA